MVIIFSFSGDKSTNKLIEWLHFYHCPFKRVHLDAEDFRKIKISYNEKKEKVISLKLNNNDELFLNDISFFYSRGVGFLLKENKNDTDLPDTIFNSYIETEFESLTNSFYSYVNMKSIGYFRGEAQNKQQQLNFAIDEGLDVPPFMITSEKKNVVDFFSNSPVITKAIEDNIGVTYKSSMMYQRVQRVKIENLEDYFFPSFFQMEVRKEYEVRSFFLGNEFYSIRFHSDSKNVDMRDNFNISTYESYKLPNEIEIKLGRLIKKLNLLTGSVDLIKSFTGQYFFLEINPNGQYDWVSQAGGYYLDKKIALFLKNQDEKFKKNKPSNLF